MFFFQMNNFINKISAKLEKLDFFYQNWARFAIFGGVKTTQIFKNSHHFQMRAPKIVVHAKFHPNQRNFFFDQSLAIF